MIPHYETFIPRHANSWANPRGLGAACRRPVLRLRISRLFRAGQRIAVEDRLRSAGLRLPDRGCRFVSASVEAGDQGDWNHDGVGGFILSGRSAPLAGCHEPSAMTGALKKGLIPTTRQTLRSAGKPKPAAPALWKG